MKIIVFEGEKEVKATKEDRRMMREMSKAMDGKKVKGFKIESECKF